MKNKFEEPKLTIVSFTNEDIITSSGDVGDSEGEFHDEPEGD